MLPRHRDATQSPLISPRAGASVQHVATREPTRVVVSPLRKVAVSHSTSYQDVMIHRMRRAMAPQPTKEQIGEVAHAMLLQLGRELSRRGVTLLIKKLEPCVYTFGTDKKRVHVSIDSGRLVAKLGGGHVDLLEYLERHHHLG